MLKIIFNAINQMNMNNQMMMMQGMGMMMPNMGMNPMMPNMVMDQNYNTNKVQYMIVLILIKKMN